MGWTEYLLFIQHLWLSVISGLAGCYESLIILWPLDTRYCRLHRLEIQLVLPSYRHCHSTGYPYSPRQVFDSSQTTNCGLPGLYGYKLICLDNDFCPCNLFYQVLLDFSHRLISCQDLFEQWVVLEFNQTPTFSLHCSCLRVSVLCSDSALTLDS